MNTGDTFISVAFLAVLRHEVDLFARCSPEWRQDTAVQDVDESGTRATEAKGASLMSRLSLAAGSCAGARK